MAVEFSSSFATLASYKIRLGFATTPSVTVYAGTMPSPGDIITNWATQYNSSQSNTLWHVGVGPTLSQLSNTVISGSSPTATAPLRSGTASWYIMWSISSANITTSTIPSTKFLIGAVSDLLGDGSIKFDSTSLSSSIATTFVELTIATNFTG